MMHRPPRRSFQGFTLIELLIALAIVAILASLAFPLYTRYQERSHRSQAFADLGKCSLAMERFYTANYTYAGTAMGGGAPPGAPAAAICPSTSPETGTTYYNITVQAADTDGFTLRATPTGSQDSDGIIEITADGSRRWDENDDGDFGDAGERDWEEN